MAGQNNTPTSPHRDAPSTVARGVKRGVDLTLGTAMGLVVLPLMLLIALAIVVDSPGPVLFRPKRIGRHGKHFAMYKFRTMIKDAHERLDELTHLNVADGMVKIPDDPRVTRIGKWLRKFSLDELPQIFNIVAGHMSLVGPRPHDVHEIAVSDPEQEPRLSMRPGLTGLWQVSARSDPNLASRIHYDLLYVNRWSLLLDAKILAKTVPVVVLGKGGVVDGSLTKAASINGSGDHAGHGNGQPDPLSVANNGNGSWHGSAAATGELGLSSAAAKLPGQDDPVTSAIS